MNNTSFLVKFKEKCNLDDEFIELINEFFDKLIEFGYITQYRATKLSKRLYENIDLVILGDQNDIDYKSGYYDAIKKELYLKDPDNLESLYLRLLYVITTTSKEANHYSVGYSSSTLSEKSGKIIHGNYGINRAIVSNLVCRILYTLPSTLSIMPSYRTYENNFLGYKVTADNDIYFLEGKLLSQICYVLNINEENLYYNIFSDSPYKYLEKKLKRTKLYEYDQLIKTLDMISREYSNYNKLCYFEKLLNDNFISIKKHILSDNISELQKEQKRIKLAIFNAIEKLSSKNAKDMEDDINEFNLEVDAGLSEKISSLEDDIIQEISNMQNMLADTIIEYERSLPHIDFAIRLKTMQNMLILKNPKIDSILYKTITENLIIGNENTASNLVEKIKHSLINELLANQKYKNTQKNLSFNKISGLTDETDIAYITLNVDNSFVELMQVNDLKNSTKNLSANVKEVDLKNLKHMFSSDFLNMNIHKIELLFSSIKKKYVKFANIHLENMFICDIEDFNLLIIVEKAKLNIFKINFNDIKDENFQIEPCEISENYMVYDINNVLKTSSANLPVLYKAKEGLFRRIWSLFTWY